MPYVILKADCAVRILETDESTAQAAVAEGLGDRYVLLDGNCIIGQRYADGVFTDEPADPAVAHQAAKSLKLKRAENDYLAILARLPITLTATDNSDSIKEKLLAAGVPKIDILEIAVGLLAAIHDVELAGGSWYDLPSVPHQL